MGHISLVPRGRIIRNVRKIRRSSAREIDAKERCLVTTKVAEDVEVRRSIVMEISHGASDYRDTLATRGLQILSGYNPRRWCTTYDKVDVLAGKRTITVMLDEVASYRTDKVITDIVC